MNAALAQLLAHYGQRDPEDASSGSPWADNLPRLRSLQPIERESPWMPVEIDPAVRGYEFNPDLLNDRNAPYPSPFLGDPETRRLIGHYRR